MQHCQRYQSRNPAVSNAPHQAITPVLGPMKPSGQQQIFVPSASPTAHAVSSTMVTTVKSNPVPGLIGATNAEAPTQALCVNKLAKNFNALPAEVSTPINIFELSKELINYTSMGLLMH